MGRSLASAGAGAGARSVASWSPARLSAAQLLVQLEPTSLDDFASSSGGSGAIVSGGEAGWARDRSLNANHLVQATALQRPVVKTHARSPFVAIHGSGELGAGGDFLASGAAVSTAKYLWLVASIIGPNVTRGVGSPVGLFSDGYHGFAGTAPVSASAVLATGFSGTNTWGQYSLASYRRDGASISAAAADAGLGRSISVYRFEHSSTADAGALHVGHHVSYDGFYGRGAILAAFVGSSALSAADVAAMDSYVEGRYLAGPAVVLTGDSLAAGYDLQEVQSPSALLHEAYGRTVPCPTIAIPGRGVGSSVSPMVDTLLTADAAQLAPLKARRSPAVLVVLAGTNDLYNGRSATQLLADLQTYVAARRAEGWKVVVATVAPRTIDSGSTPWPAIKEAQRLIFNAALRLSWASWSDGLWDVDAYAPALAADGVHWTAAGTASAVTGLLPILDGLLGAPAGNALLTEGGDTLTTEAGYRLTF